MGWFERHFGPSNLVSEPRGTTARDKLRVGAKSWRAPDWGVDPSQAARPRRESGAQPVASSSRYAEPEPRRPASAAPAPSSQQRSGSPHRSRSVLPQHGVPFYPPPRSKTPEDSEAYQKPIMTSAPFRKYTAVPPKSPRSREYDDFLAARAAAEDPTRARRSSMGQHGSVPPTGGPQRRPEDVARSRSTAPTAGQRHQNESHEARRSSDLRDARAAREEERARLRRSSSRATLRPSQPAGPPHDHRGPAQDAGQDEAFGEEYMPLEPGPRQQRSSVPFPTANPHFQAAPTQTAHRAPSPSQMRPPPPPASSLPMHFAHLRTTNRSPPPPVQQPAQRSQSAAPTQPLSESAMRRHLQLQEIRRRQEEELERRRQAAEEARQQREEQLQLEAERKAERRARRAARLAAQREAEEEEAWRRQEEERQLEAQREAEEAWRRQEERRQLEAERAERQARFEARLEAQREALREAERETLREGARRELARRRREARRSGVMPNWWPHPASAPSARPTREPQADARAAAEHLHQLSAPQLAQLAIASGVIEAEDPIVQEVLGQRGRFAGGSTDGSLRSFSTSEMESIGTASLVDMMLRWGWDDDPEVQTYLSEPQEWLQPWRNQRIGDRIERAMYEGRMPRLTPSTGTPMPHNVADTLARRNRRHWSMSDAPPLGRREG